MWIYLGYSKKLKANVYSDGKDLFIQRYGGRVDGKVKWKWERIENAKAVLKELGEEKLLKKLEKRFTLVTEQEIPPYAIDVLKECLSHVMYCSKLANRIIKIAKEYGVEPLECLEAANRALKILEEYFS